MVWDQLLSLKRYGDTHKRLRHEQDETRLGFEVDYDRVIFSTAFRSLQDKTQVIPLSKTDFVHTRLTHSLEVSVVGRSLGRRVGQQLLQRHPHLQTVQGHHFNDFGAIVAAAALAHDVGNPPFGHSGEKAIGEYFSRGSGKDFKHQLSPEEYEDLCSFEGNANGLRILCEHREGVKGGLRLSYATLGTFMKYPKQSLPKKPTSHIADKKYGFFQTEKEFVAEVAEELGLFKIGTKENYRFARHPLTYLVEAADDICYTLIDFEDGINLGWIPEEYALEYLINLVKDSLQTDKYYALRHTEDRISYLRALSINALIKDATRIFLENEMAILQGSFGHSLMEHSHYRPQIEDILKLSVERVYRSSQVVEKEIAGYTVLQGLLDVFCNAIINIAGDRASHYDRWAIRLLPERYQMPSPSNYENLLTMCCFVAGLTDGRALTLFQKIKGA